MEVIVVEKCDIHPTVPISQLVDIFQQLVKEFALPVCEPVDEGRGLYFAQAGGSFAGSGGPSGSKCIFNETNDQYPARSAVEVEHRVITRDYGAMSHKYVVSHLTWTIDSTPTTLATQEPSKSAESEILDRQRGWSLGTGATGSERPRSPLSHGKKILKWGIRKVLRQTHKAKETRQLERLHTIAGISKFCFKWKQLLAERGLIVLPVEITNDLSGRLSNLHLQQQGRLRSSSSDIVEEQKSDDQGAFNMDSNRFVPVQLRQGYQRNLRNSVVALRETIGSSEPLPSALKLVDTRRASCNQSKGERAKKVDFADVRKELDLGMTVEDRAARMSLGAVVVSRTGQVRPVVEMKTGLPIYLSPEGDFICVGTTPLKAVGKNKRKKKRPHRNRRKQAALLKQQQLEQQQQQANVNKASPPVSPANNKQSVYINNQTQSAPMARSAPLPPSTGNNQVPQLSPRQSIGVDTHHRPPNLMIPSSLFVDPGSPRDSPSQSRGRVFSPLSSPSAAMLFQRAGRFASERLSNTPQPKSSISPRNIQDLRNVMATVEIQGTSSPSGALSNDKHFWSRAGPMSTTSQQRNQQQRHQLQRHSSSEDHNVNIQPRNTTRQNSPRNNDSESFSSPAQTA